jgi:hypothetical protein
LLRRVGNGRKVVFAPFHIGGVKFSDNIDVATKLQALQAVERKSIWLGSYMVHNANTLREKRVNFHV